LRKRGREREQKILPGRGLPGSQYFGTRLNLALDGELHCAQAAVGDTFALIPIDPSGRLDDAATRFAACRMCCGLRRARRDSGAQRSGTPGGGLNNAWRR
jgi:hypothetical protein